MSSLHIVVDQLKDWHEYFPTENLISVEDYLHTEHKRKHRVQVINLCASYRYLSNGYYCSLLAAARGHLAFPTVKTINDLNNNAAYAFDPDLFPETRDALPTQGDEPAEYRLRIFFGQCEETELHKLARALFEQFPCPILEARLKFADGWRVAGIKSLALTSLSDHQQDQFARALDDFSRKIWRKPRGRKGYRYEIAILVSDQDRTPPSNPKALKKFEREARKLGLDVDFIGRRDYIRLAEYDALFIRETTSIANHTYRFAKRAENEGLAVIDDPESIIRCTNKVYLANLLENHGIDAPRTVIISRDRPQQIERAAEELGLPLVLKIPDGSFSLGVDKIETLEELHSACARQLKRSSLLLAQEFIPTDFDWRIGMLDNKPLYACQYFMSRGHWQIYEYKSDGKMGSGDANCVPIHEVPKPVLRAAKRASRLIGEGLYGVDVKFRDGQAYVIEVNDNPSIDAGVEDLCLGDMLYSQIMQNLLQRIESRHYKPA